MEDLEKKLKELLVKYGEEWDQSIADDLGCDEAEKVADFFNNGGLEMWNPHTREHTAITFVALCEDGSVDIGCWVWGYGDDFDADAEWHVLNPAYFYDFELKAINDKIEEIYDHEGSRD